jgi:hypothetical protein
LASFKSMMRNRTGDLVSPQLRALFNSRPSLARGHCCSLVSVETGMLEPLGYTTLALCFIALLCVLGLAFND